MDSCQMSTVLSKNAFGKVFIRKIGNVLEITQKPWKPHVKVTMSLDTL